MKDEKERLGGLNQREWQAYDLETDACVDKYALDIEAANQPDLMRKWMELLAEANTKLSKAKEALICIESNLFLEVRKNGIPGIEGKLTEAVIKSWIIVQDKYRLALKRKIKAEGDVAYLNAAKTALEHKKEMIKVEANLWICGYYARPGIKPIVSAEQQECRQQEVSHQLRQSLQQRNKHKDEEE